MRFDQIQTFNTNLNQQALLCEQMIAFHEQEISRLKSAVRALRSLASTEPNPDDVAIDVQPFQLPGIFKQKPGQVVRDFGRHGVIGSGTSAPLGGDIQNVVDEGMSLQEMEAEISGAVSGKQAATQARN